ncbi:MAG TPA: hypothetical protein VGG69_12445 [Rhizomicrobium sp.]
MLGRDGRWHFRQPRQRYKYRQYPATAANGDVMAETRFVILKEDEGDFVPFGHVAKPLTFVEAKAEVAALAAQYPDQMFHIFGDCGAAIHQDSIFLDLKTPDLAGPKPQAVTPIKKVSSGSEA